ncbi:alcohol dehydrogenase catalytic domain-containing protein [Rubrivivax albus]|uniref:Alcohol dehydrogenase n=1 Tax=Rubrivivax albus TaxID=2499835 RepID=A0A3S2VWI7_9BURK|nr:alcohol dehydrogenase catalytic domain-containing protein [Rubrivivax albus]RVT50895.1 alcohol dehydrogenase [Rubrivivax albus]
MNPTYRALQVTRPGVLELVERLTPTPAVGEVLIRVEACGLCGADIGDIEGANAVQQPPRVPGHEVVGRLVALGEQVPPMWRLGQRVGVGRLGGHCQACPMCRRGLFNLCQDQAFVGATRDGGYAEMMLARATGLVSIPDELDAHEAAPLLCAGLATFNALKKCGAEAGDTVAILGIGGLGHLALQYARRMGFRVLAIGRGADIAQEALALGAHRYVDALVEDAVAALKQLGGAQAIVATIGHAATVSALLGALAPTGRLVLLGGGKEPLAVPIGPLVVGERSIAGSITGTPHESERTLDFSVLAGVQPRVEVVPFERAPDAYQRLKSGQAKFRVVLSMPALPG